MIALLAAIENEELFTGIFLSSAGLEIDPNLSGPVLVSTSSTSLVSIPCHCWKCV